MGRSPPRFGFFGPRFGPFPAFWLGRRSRPGRDRAEKGSVGGGCHGVGGPGASGRWRSSWGIVDARRLSFGRNQPTDFCGVVGEDPAQVTASAEVGGAVTAVSRHLLWARPSSLLIRAPPGPKAARQKGCPHGRFHRQRSRPRCQRPGRELDGLADPAFLMGRALLSCKLTRRLAESGVCPATRKRVGATMRSRRSMSTSIRPGWCEPCPTGKRRPDADPAGR